MLRNLPIICNFCAFVFVRPWHLMFSQNKLTSVVEHAKVGLENACEVMVRAITSRSGWLKFQFQQCRWIPMFQDPPYSLYGRLKKHCWNWNLNCHERGVRAWTIASHAFSSPTFACSTTLANLFWVRTNCHGRTKINAQKWQIMGKLSSIDTAGF